MRFLLSYTPNTGSVFYSIAAVLCRLSSINLVNHTPFIHIFTGISRLGTKKSAFDTFSEKILYIDSKEREAINSSGKEQNYEGKEARRQKRLDIREELTNAPVHSSVPEGIIGLKKTFKRKDYRARPGRAVQQFLAFPLTHRSIHHTF